MANHWKDKHHREVSEAKSFSELLATAHDIIDLIPGPASLVAGPISTGGHGSITKNLKDLGNAIAKIEMQGEYVFNQLPFEAKFGELSKDYDGYCLPILEDFFLPIFKSGKIKKIWFAPGWETSTGAKWEYETAGRLGIPRVLIEGK